MLSLARLVAAAEAAATGSISAGRRPATDYGMRFTIVTVRRSHRW